MHLARCAVLEQGPEGGAHGIDLAPLGEGRVFAGAAAVPFSCGRVGIAWGTPTGLHGLGVGARVGVRRGVRVAGKTRVTRAEQNS